MFDVTNIYCDNGWRLGFPMRMYRDADDGGVEWIEANSYNNGSTDWTKLPDTGTSTEELLNYRLLYVMPDDA